MCKYFLPQNISRKTVNEIFSASKDFYSANGAEDAYEILMTDKEKTSIIIKIQTGNDNSAREFDETIGWFLNKWQSHYRYCRTTELVPILKKIVIIIKKKFCGISLEKIEDKHITIIQDIFESIIKIQHVNTTIASKILSVIKPETFIMWDQGIAEEYGYAQNSQGYCRFIQTMRDTVRKLRELEPPILEEKIKSLGRNWDPPIAKIIDEWNIMTKKNA